VVFDPSKDVTIDARTLPASKDGQFIEVKKASYNDGDEKIQLTRFDLTGEPRKFLKLGRLSLDEAARVKDAIEELIK
jgi:hypothetical protein